METTARVFVSMSWRLPERYNTTAFECDAINSSTSCGNYNPSTDDYVTSLGSKSTGNKIDGLLRGDALVSTTKGYMILFESYIYDQNGNKNGIRVMEQTPPKARYWNWTWVDLASYRPIRRNNIDEGNYVFVTKWGSYGSGDGQFYYPEGIAVDSSLNVYVADVLNYRIQKIKPVSPYPSAPSNLIATVASATQINLSWIDNSDNETGFKIKRKAGVNGQYATIGAVGANVRSYSDNSVSSGIVYYYIRACNNSVCSPETNTAIVPYRPTNLTATVVSSTQINLSWTDNSSNETGFQIQRKAGLCSSTNVWGLIATKVANVISHSHTGLVAGTTYSYRTRSIVRSSTTPYAFGYSLWSNCVSGTTP